VVLEFKLDPEVVQVEVVAVELVSDRPQKLVRVEHQAHHHECLHLDHGALVLYDVVLVL